MLHTWRWKLSRPHSAGITHWVWDDTTKLITGYSGDTIIRQPYSCRTAIRWFARHANQWEPVDADYLMDEGL